MPSQQLYIANLPHMSMIIIGDHEYVRGFASDIFWLLKLLLEMASGSDDVRGPCPGFNALANHGYISRNSVASVTSLTTASNKGMCSCMLSLEIRLMTISVFDMGLDLAAFLAVYSGVISGDITTCSIGGKPKNGGGLLGGLTNSLGLLGEPQGLSISHNRFEADAWPLRGDLYKTYVTTNTTTA
jgi:hypothetical protein